MYELIIFDWDGTLMDSAQKIANCIQASARDVGLVEPDDQKAKSIIGLGLHEAMQILFEKASDDQLNELVVRYKYHYLTGDVTEQPMFDGVVEGLNALQEAGAVLSIATGKSRAGLDRILNEVQLKDQFIYTRCADEARSKPHPQMLYDILDFTALDPKSCIMVGDTTFDMNMATGANMHGLGVSYGVHSTEQLQQAQAVDVMPSFAHVLQWLLNDRVKKAYV